MASEHLKGYLGKATSFGRELISRGASPKPIVLVTGVGINDTWVGTDDTELDEVLIVAGAANNGDVRLSLYAVVGAANYVTLTAKDSVKLGGVKYDDINLKFIADGDTVSILRVEADGALADAETV